jgi:hypothetical protein
MSGIEDCHLFTDRYYSSVELAQELDNWKCKYTCCFLTLCPCCTDFSCKTLHLMARQPFKTPSSCLWKFFQMCRPERVKSVYECSTSIWKEYTKLIFVPSFWP